MEKVLGSEIRAELARHNVTIDSAASVMGISRQGLYMKLQGRSSFKATELDRLAQYLGLGTNEFFRRAEEAARARGPQPSVNSSGKDVA